MAHSWLKQTCVAFVPGSLTAPLESHFIASLLDGFRLLGHSVQEAPDEHTDILITTAPFDRPISWRESLLFTGRVRFKYRHNPTVFTVVPVTPPQLEEMLAYFERALQKDSPDPADYAFPGLAPDAYRVLHEQGRRGGPILSLERLLQARTKCIQVLLLVGETEPLSVYHFDLVGAFARTDARTGALGNPAFYEEIALKIVTRVSTHEITAHQVVGEPLTEQAWRAAQTPAAMLEAARQLDGRGFFTDTVHIDALVNVPAVSDAVASQYSEGCFSTWDPDLNALVSTVTGSARPVSKGSIGEDDLALITGVRMDGQGALVRHVQGRRNDPPSSEAVEMIGMDSRLPRIKIDWEGQQVEVPVIRSRLHGHRGISAYHADLVEFVPMDDPYFIYPVSCGTEAQARGVIDTFARSQALQNPSDPRGVVFTILPTHGVLIVEKWVPGTKPFQTIWEYFDRGHLVLDSHVPQGPLAYVEEMGTRVLKPLYEHTHLPG